MNSTATVAELAAWLRDPTSSKESAGTFLDFVTVAAMFFRNLILLAVFAPRAVSMAFASIAVMGGGAAASIWVSRVFGEPTEELQISSPLSIRKLLSFGTLFLAIQMAGTMGTRYLGHYGVLMVSMLGGLVSNAVQLVQPLCSPHMARRHPISQLWQLAASIASVLFPPYP